MDASESTSEPMNRREALGMIGTASAALSLASAVQPEPGAGNAAVSIACFIRYQIDPFQIDAFKAYARTWGDIIPRCGGHLIGYFVPHEGTNDVAWGLIAFDSLASYERYRARLKADPDARQNLLTAQTKRFILREERNFVAIVRDTFEVPAKAAADAR